MSRFMPKWGDFKNVNVTAGLVVVGDALCVQLVVAANTPDGPRVKSTQHVSLTPFFDKAVPPAGEEPPPAKE